MATAVSFFC